MKRAKKLHLLPIIRHCERRAIVFRKLMALALLPADDIAQAFHWLSSHTALDIRLDFAELFQYYDRYWLQRITPQVFSVFGMACKTNNAMEAYHRVLQIRMGIHPLVWQFTGMQKLYNSISLSLQKKSSVYLLTLRL